MANCPRIDSPATIAAMARTLAGGSACVDPPDIGMDDVPAKRRSTESKSSVSPLTPKALGLPAWNLSSPETRRLLRADYGENDSDAAAFMLC